MGRWLKKVQECHGEAPTKLTELGFVGFVSTPSGRFQEKTQLDPVAVAANDQLLNSRDWLDCVAQKLGTDAEDLLANGHLELHDLAELAGCDTDLVANTIRHSPAWINRRQSGERRADCIAETISKSQHVIHTAATATSEWRAARDRYHNHLMRCRDCYAPSKRYCSEGTQLRQAYNSLFTKNVQ